MEFLDLSSALTVYVLPSLFSAAVSVVTLILLLTRPQKPPGIVFLHYFLIAIVIWSLGYSAELVLADLPGKFYAAGVKYIGVMAIPVLWLLFALYYSGQQRILTPGRVVLLLVIPVATLLLVWSNDLHHLYWSDVQLDTTLAPIPLLECTSGPFFYVAATYNYSLMAAGTVILLRMALTSTPRFRDQILVMSLAALVPWLANATYLAGIDILPGLDMTPASFVFGSVLVTIGVTGFRLFDLIPIARGAVFDGIVSAVIVVDDYARVIDLNDAAIELLGSPGPDSMGVSLDRISGTYSDALEPYLTDEKSRGEVALLDGEQLRYFDVRVSPLQDSVGGIRGRVVVLHEVTARRQAEDALRESEARYRLLAEEATDLISSHTVEGVFLYASPAAETITGWLPEEMIGRSIFEFIYPDDVELVQRALEALVTDEDPRDVQFRVVRKDGVLRWAESSGRLICDPETGAVQFLTVITRDVTTRVEAEIDLREGEERYRTLLSAAFETIVLTDDGRIVDANRTFESMFGYPHHTAFGMPVTDLATPASVDAIQQAVVDASEQPQELVLRRQDGSEFYAEVRVKPLTYKGRRVEVMALRDLTERKRIESTEYEQRALAEALRDTAAVLNSTLNLDTVLDRILENVGRVVPHDTANIMLIEDGVARVVRGRGYASEEAAPLSVRVPVEDVLTFQRMADTHEPIIVSDVTTDRNWRALAEGMEWLRSWLGAPICLGDEMIGIVNLDSHTPHFFRPQHATSLRTFADQAATAIKNARLYGGTVEQNQRLGLLTHITRLGAATLDLQELLQTVAESAGLIIGADSCIVMLWNDEKSRVIDAASSGLPHSEASDLVDDEACQALAESVVESRISIQLPDVESSDLFPDGATWNYPVKSALLLPLWAADRRLGALLMGFSGRRILADEEIRWAEQAADLVALSITKAQAFAELESRNRDLDAFSHTVAHDLKGPLSGLISFLDLLEEVEGENLGAEGHQMLAFAERSAERMKRIIDGLHMLARLTEGSDPLEPVSMQMVVQAVLERFRDELDEMDFTVEVADDLPPVLGQSVWLEETVANLVSNAIKYIGIDNEDPCLRIAGWRRGDVVRYEISDNGIGIELGDQGHLFDSFSRFHRESADGLGLGLSIVQRVIARLNGRLGVQSHPGEGSTFWFELPAAPLGGAPSAY